MTAEEQAELETVKHERDELMKIAEMVVASAKPALGQIYINPVTQHRFENVLERIKTRRRV
jgi:hypothetical protein